MFKIRRAVVVDLAGFGLFNVAGTSIGSIDVTAFFSYLVESLAKFVAEPEQEYGLVAAKNRQFEFIEQISQPFGRQIEKIVEKS